MSSKMRTYAEKELGVHQVHDTALKANGEIIDLNIKLIDARARRREFTEQIADREAVILKSIRDNHTDLSVTAQDAKAKIERRTDRELHDMRTGLLSAQREEDETEQAIKTCQNRLNTANARMIQLGGYFPYLVAIMQSEAAAQPNTP